MLSIWIQQTPRMPPFRVCCHGRCNQVDIADQSIVCSITTATEVRNSKRHEVIMSAPTYLGFVLKFRWEFCGGIGRGFPKIRWRLAGDQLSSSLTFFFSGRIMSESFTTLSPKPPLRYVRLSIPSQ